MKAPTSWLPRWAALYLAAMLLLSGALHQLGDRWWPATVVMYAPRWPWALPLLVLLPWALWRRGRPLWMTLAGAAVWLLGVAHFNLPVPAHWWPGEHSADLRVMSYNVGEAPTHPQALLDLLGREAPDVALLQECGKLATAAGPALQAAGWTLRVDHGTCLVSRWPLRQAKVLDPTPVWQMQGQGVAARYELQGPGLVVNVVNLHLETVRRGLQEVLWRGWGGAAALQDVTEQRALEAGRAQAFIASAPATVPLLVAGDFNMPQQSTLFARHFGHLANTFGEAGWGFGDSKFTRLHGVRIDHVLAGPGWAVRRAWVAPHLGGDHRPMMAELSWVGQAP